MPDNTKDQWISAIHNAIRQYTEVNGTAKNLEGATREFAVGVQASEEDLRLMVAKASAAAAAAAAKVIEETVRDIASRLTNQANQLDTNNQGVTQFNRTARGATAQAFGNNGAARAEIERGHQVVDGDADAVRGMISVARQKITEARELGEKISKAVGDATIKATNNGAVQVMDSIAKARDTVQAVNNLATRQQATTAGMAARAQRAIGEIRAL